MIILLIPLLIALTLLVETALVKWFFWALYDVDLISHSLDWGQSFTVALPLWVASIIGFWGSSRD